MAKKQEKITPVFDPTKNYTWQPTDEFTFTGLELIALHRVLAEFLTGDCNNVQNILKLSELFTLVQNKIAEYALKGTIVESTPEVVN